MEDAAVTTPVSRPRPRARYILEARWPHRAVLTTGAPQQAGLSAIEQVIAELNAQPKVTVG